MESLVKRSTRVYEELFEACQKDGFRGYDPFDGLSSSIFQSLPLLGSNAAARLVWLQIVKRFPLQVRGLLRIPPKVNPKGLALFLSAECLLLRKDKDDRKLQRAARMSDELLGMTIDSSNGIAWGYPFDWQSRAFFAPQGTPTVVPTVFAANALLDLYEINSDRQLLETAERVAGFIVGDLNRPIETGAELCFSYTPLDSSIILNASLLAAELLARVASVNQTENYRDLIERSVTFAVERQDERGAWAYGSKLRHKWVDNFHTAFILNSLQRISRYSGIDVSEEVRMGFQYWTSHFFSEEGAPYYYDTQQYPLDAHSAAAAIQCLAAWPEQENSRELAESVLKWTLDNMLLKSGRFTYQKLRFFDKRLEFTRWNDAWMAYALAQFISSQEDR